MNNINKISKPSRVILSSLMMMSIVGVTVEGGNMINTSYAATANKSYKYVQPAGSKTINVRATTSTTSKVKGTLRPGEFATVISTTPSWYKVRLGNGVEGYIRADVAKKADNSSAVKGQICVQARKTTKNLNLRSLIGTTNGKVLLTIPKGTKISTLKFYRESSSRYWYQVSYGGKTGWVYGPYTEKYDAGKDAPSYDKTAEQFTATGEVKDAPSGLIVRSRASTKGSKVKSIKNGTVVAITRRAQTDGKYWYYLPAHNGWVHSSYMRLHGDKNNNKRSVDAEIVNVAIMKAKESRIAANDKLNLVSSKEVSETNGTITGDGVRVRKGAGTNHAVITKLYKGNKVTILEGNKSGWTKISYGEYTGYVSSDYVKVNGSSSSSSSETNGVKSYEVHVIGEKTDVNGGRLDKIIVNIPESEKDIINQLENGEIVKLELTQERNNFRIHGSSVVSDEEASKLINTLQFFTIEDQSAKVYQSVEDEMKEIACTLNVGEMVILLHNEPESEFVKVMFEDGGVGYIKKAALN